MKKKFVIALLSTLMLQGSALAAQLDTIEFDRDTRMVTVSGKLDSANSFVTIELLAPGCIWEDVEKDRLAFDKLAYFNQTRSDGNGSYSFVFQLKDKTEKYPVRIFSPVDNEYCYDNDTLRTFAAGDIAALLQRAAGAKSAQELAFLTEADSAEILGLDISCLDGVTDKALFLEGVYAEASQSGIKTIEDIQTAFNSGYIVYLLNKAETAGEMTELLEKYSEYFGLDDTYSQNLFDDESIYDSKRKSNVLLQLAGISFKTISGFKETYGDSILLYACYQQDNYNKIDDIITKSGILKKYDIGKYSSLSAKAKIDVQKTINACSKPYASVAELAAAIKKASDPSVPSNPSYAGGGSGGGSGGNSGGHSGGGLTTPVINPSDTATKPVKGKFSDMTGYEWAEEAVTTLRDAGIISGRSEDEFYPGDNVTREEFLKMLTGAMNKSNEGTVSEFEDVKEDDWYYGAVNVGVQLGITNGMSDKIFGVGVPITRQDMAVMVYRALISMGMNFSDDTEAGVFNDADEISEYASEPVRLLTAAAMINGTGNNMFEPKIMVNRASAAKLICEVYKWGKDNA